MNLISMKLNVSDYLISRVLNRGYDWYNNPPKHGALGRKSPEQYLRENDLISGSY
jgi:transposase InsO family protein